MSTRATTRVPIHDLLALRWSPRAFSERLVERAALASVLEAARWAPSSYNEQPWSFIVAARADAEAHERLASCLVPGNARWAAKVPVLLLSVARLSFARNGKPNRHAYHDVGLAALSLVVQAQALGLATHQMAGFDVERARDVCAIPAGFDPVAMIALGYPGAESALPEDLRAGEAAPRSRKALEEIAFAGRFGAPAKL